jgi:hypothetical protein
MAAAGSPAPRDPRACCSCSRSALVVVAVLAVDLGHVRGDVAPAAATNIPLEKN